MRANFEYDFLDEFEIDFGKKRVERWFDYDV